MEIKEAVIKAVRDIPDFPVKGVIFKDITTWRYLMVKTNVKRLKK